MQKTKNRRIRKALVFASVFVILLTAFSSVIFAQAPDFEDIYYIPHVGRYSKILYFYEHDTSNLICSVNIDYVVDNVEISNCNIIFSEYYYNTYFTGERLSDFTSFSAIYGDCYMIGLSNTATIQNATFNNTTLYSLLSPRGFSSALFSQYFNTSYDNQLGYWNYYKSYYDVSYEIGYTHALQNTNAFESALYTIFNAPFVFVKNIIGFEIFGITLVDVLCGALLLCLGFVLLKFIGGAIPL